MANSGHEGTQEAAAEESERVGDITFRNLDVVEVVDV